jgi:2-haloacid dehalogenase
LAAMGTPVFAHRPISAVVFDALALFDLRPLAKIAVQLYPEEGAALLQMWRGRQFEYQWLRSLGNRYVDFWQATQDSLTYAARQVGVTLGTEARNRLLAPYAELQAWSDVADVLPRMARDGLNLGVLSNMTGAMLESGLRRANVRGFFSHLISTDTVRCYKPSPAAYQLGVSALGLARSDILYVAFAGWDVAGSVWFGYPTYWLNRLSSVTEALGAVPLATGKDLESLLAFIGTLKDRSRS